jgi:hypothetical protein
MVISSIQLARCQTTEHQEMSKTSFNLPVANIREKESRKGKRKNKENGSGSGKNLKGKNKKKDTQVASE